MYAFTSAIIFKSPSVMIQAISNIVHLSISKPNNDKKGGTNNNYGRDIKIYYFQTLILTNHLSSVQRELSTFISHKHNIREKEQ